MAVQKVKDIPKTFSEQERVEDRPYYYRNINDDGFPTVLTVPQMAEFLQIGIDKAYKMTHWKGFPSIKIGRQIRVSKYELLEWLSKEKGKEVKL